MQMYPEIKCFVRETLGCSCPEEVFNKIDYQEERDGTSGSKINVGDCLLIYVITTDGESNIQGVIDPALERGVEERDKKGLIDSVWCLLLRVLMSCAVRLNVHSIVQDILMKRRTFMLWTKVIMPGDRGPFRQDSGMDKAGKQWQRLLNGCEFQRK